MQLIQLQYFCTVARTKNMSRASEELWISQPALSKAISGLEEELGVRLFDRIGRSISLNEAGEIYYEKISHILLMINDATKQVRDLHENSTNKVVLLLSAANFISNWLWQMFHQQYPEIALLVNSCYSATRSDVQQSDFLIFATPVTFGNLACVELLEEELMLGMSKNHPLAQKKSIRLKDTAPYVFQCLPANENLRVNLQNFCNQVGFQPQVGFSTEDSFTFFDVLASNNFITMVPAVTAAPAMREDIVLRPIEEPHCTRTIKIGWSTDHYMSASAKLFLDFAQEIFAGNKLRDLMAEKTGTEAGEKESD